MPHPSLLVSLSGERRHASGAGDARREYRLGPLDVLLVAPGTWLETWYERANTAISIRADGHTIRLVYITASVPEGGVLARGEPGQVLELPDAGGERVAALLRLVLADAAPADPGYLRAAGALVVAELVRVLDAAPSTHERGKAESTWRMLCGWVEESVGTRSARADAATAIGVHPNHVSRICRGRGTTYSRLVHQARVEYACRLLSTTSLAVAEVGYRAGYEDQPNFHRHFRAHTGLTPSAYRAGRLAGS